MNYLFDWKKYIENYPDLKFINTQEKAIRHWNRYGKNDDRKGYM